MSNLHKNLLDDQIHHPKGFVTASNDTKLTKNASGLLEWQTNSGGGGSVTSLTTSGTSGVSTLNSGVLNIPNYTSSGNEDVYIATTWQACINYTNGERGIVPVIMTNPCSINGNKHVQVLASSLVSSADILMPGARLNITKNSTLNYAIVGKVLALGVSPQCELKMCILRLVCSGEQPKTYTLIPIHTISIPALATNGFFCIDDSTAFSTPLLKGDMLVPVILTNAGTTNLTYNLTIETKHII